MLPGASGSRWMPRKIAGSAMMTIDPSSADMNTASGGVRQRDPPVAVVGLRLELVGAMLQVVRQSLEQRRGRQQLLEFGGGEAGDSARASCSMRALRRSLEHAGRPR